MTNEHGGWKKNEETKVWELEDTVINIFVSLYKHLEIEDAYLATVRWTYPKGENHYGTHLKIQSDDGNEEHLLMNASAFVTNWLAENGDQDQPGNQEEA